MGVGHYENFPVASLLLPARLRPAVRAIYRFARTADDIADEGTATAAQRLGALRALGEQLDLIGAGGDGQWPDLAQAVRAHRLPLGPLRDLLSAFAQDVTVSRYADFDALFDYCRRSADPVGRLLLALYGRNDPAAQMQSDAICTGLQLTNFWQDVALDWRNGRLYIPRAELERFGVPEHMIGSAPTSAAWAALMRHLTGRAGALLWAGAPLARALGGRVGLELRLVVQGGLRILERIDAARGDVFRHRPRLRTIDWLLMARRALTM
jgi:squalene synthase HpnC